MPTKPPEFFARERKPIPFEFVLDELERVAPETRPMFGCTAVYVGEKIVMVLRKKGPGQDDGVWLATTKDHHQSLSKIFPSMRSISVLGSGVTGWQVLPAEAADFEESVMLACSLILQGDERIGKIPASKKPRIKSPRQSRSPARSRRSK